VPLQGCTLAFGEEQSNKSWNLMTMAGEYNLGPKFGDLQPQTSNKKCLLFLSCFMFVVPFMFHVSYLLFVSCFVRSAGTSQINFAKGELVAKIHFEERAERADESLSMELVLDEHLITLF